MVHHLRHSEIDYVKWDIIIEQSVNSLIYAFSWYLDIASPGWEAFVNEVNGVYLAVMPLPVHKKMGVRYLKQPVFTQQLGLFYCSEAIPTTADWQVISKLLRRHFRYITSYSFNTGNADLLMDDKIGLPSSTLSTHHLILQPLYTEIQHNYNQNRRRHLAHARRQCIYIEPTTNIELLIQLFAENTAGNIYGLLGEAYEYPQLRALYYMAQKNSKTIFWQARTAADEVVAMVLLWKSNDQLTYIFNASTPAGKRMGAITLLLDEIFRSYAGQPILFDFEAPPVPNLQQFYGGFGTVAAPFLTINYNGLPWPLKQLNSTRIAWQRRLLNYWR